MKKLFSFLLFLFTIHFSLAAQAIEIALEFHTKEVQGSGRYANLVLTGESESHGTITIYLNEFSGAYKTYEVYYATVGKTVLTGSATWSKEEYTEIVDANLSTAQFGETPTEDDMQFHIVGTYVEKREVTLSFAGFSNFGYDENYNDWFMRIEGNDPSTPEYGYKVELAYYAPANNGYGTFTSDAEQINMADSYIHTPSGDVMLEQVVLTVEKKKVSDNLTQTIAQATLVGKNGVTYYVTCTHNSITPKQQISAQLPCATLTRSADSFTFDADCQYYDVSLVVNSNVLLGKFPMKSIDLTQSYFRYNDVKLEILSIQAEVKTQTVGGDLACVAQVAFLTKDTIQYVLSLVNTLPQPTDTVDLIATNLIVSDALAEILGVVNFDAKNAQYILSGSWVGSEAKEGVYTEEEVSVEMQDIANNLTIRALDITLEVKMDDLGHWTIAGSMRGDDNVVYALALSYVVPTPRDTVVVRFNKSSLASFTPDMNNDLLFENQDDHYYASINIRGVEMESDFSMLDVDRDFCGVKDSLTGVSTELADINGRIFQVADTTFMQAELISMDAVLYDVELWYVVPTPVDTVVLEFPVEFGDLRSEEGFYQLYGPSPDTSYVVAFSPMSDAIEGTFVNDGLFGKFGAEGGRLEMNYRNTYIATMDGSYVTSIMPLEKGEMTVTMDQDGNITAVAEAICADGIYYHITMTSKYVREYLRGDAQTGNVDKTYTVDDHYTTEDYSDDGYVYVAITAANGLDMTAMHFFVDSADSEILIPEGVYQINKSYRPGTVLASTGPNEENQLSTPFYATMTEQGYLADVYMWVKGTVEVKKKDGAIYMEVNALNSYDVPVHIIYDGAAKTDVKNIAVEKSVWKKQIRNGQLLIIHNDTTYNVMGSRVDD